MDLPCTVREVLDALSNFYLDKLLYDIYSLLPDVWSVKYRNKSVR